MKKVYLLSSIALTVCLMLTSCNKEEFEQQPTEAEAITIAEEVLGFNIDPNQDWNMTQNVTANVTVNMDYGEKYIVTVYSNDPLVDKIGYELASGAIENGQTFTAQVVAPKAKKSLVIGIANSKGFTYYKSVPVDNGNLNTKFGTTAAPQYISTYAPNFAPSFAANRSITEPSVPDITIPNADYVNTYLDGAVEPNETNTTHNNNGKYWVDGTERTWVVDSKTWIVDVPGHNEDIIENRWVDGVDWGWQFAGVAATIATGYGHEWFNYKNQGISDTDYNYWVTYCLPYIQENWAFYGATNKNGAATKLIVDYLRGSGRSSWANVWTEGREGGYQDVVVGSQWVPEQGHWEETGHWEEATEGHWVEDENWVTKFKIETGKSWNDYINVLGSEGLTDGQPNGSERTIVVKGTWNLNKDQRVGSRGQVIIANGGVLNISSGCTLELVNQSRLVVMPGATVQGAGNIKVTNGNDEGFENYNGGTINITGQFNNNFGKFYNYNKFYATQYVAGGQESNFYNHGVARINNGGTDRNAYVSPNARIFNACQWYCEQDMRAYIIEMVSGSYFYVGGQLEMSAGTDGSNDPTYVAMAAGALMQVGDLDNNNTSWVGPTSGYAVLETGGISYLNWTGSEPITSGYIINNIAVSVDDTTVGAGQGQGTDTYVALRDYILNGYGSTGDFFDPIGKTPCPDGNGGAVLVSKGGADLTLDAAEGFVAGQSGCTPGYNGTPIIIPQDKLPYSYAFEDSRNCDYDMNDVVIKATEDDEYIILKLVAAGATLDLNLRLYNYDEYSPNNNYYGTSYITLDYNDKTEVHEMMGVDKGYMINTNADNGWGANATPIEIRVSKSEYNDYRALRLAVYVPAQKGKAAYEMRLSGSGTAPYGVIIPEDWKWPREWVNVKTAYSQFEGFAEAAGTNEEWYKTPTSSAVMDENGFY